MDPMPAPNETPEHHTSHNATQLLRELETLDNDEIFQSDIKEKLATLVAAMPRSAEAEQIVVTLASWLGSDVSYGATALKATEILRTLIIATPPEKQGWIVEKLRAVEDDFEHPYRQSDAAGLLGRALTGARWYEYIDTEVKSLNPMIQRKIAMSIYLRSETLRYDEEHDEIAQIMERYTPALLEIATKQGKPYSMQAMACAQAIAVFENWVEREPDKLIDVMLKAGSAASATEEQKKGAVALLAHYISTDVSDLPAKLVSKLVSDDGVNLIAVNAIGNMAPSAIEPVLMALKTASPEQQTVVIHILPQLGKEALDEIVKLGQHGGEKLMYAIVGLAAFACRIAGGSSSPQEAKELGMLERRLRSREVDNILAAGRSSGDPAIIKQVEIFSDLMKKI